MLRRVVPLILVAIGILVQQGCRSTLPDLNLLDVHQSDASTFSFVAFGDWGRSDRKSDLYLTASTYQHIIPDLNAVFLLGNNFYPAGISSVSDPQLNMFKAMADNNPDPNLKHYVVMGNHDHGGNTQAQKDYSSVDSRWVLPDNSYRQIFRFPGNTTVCVHFVDTVQMHAEPDVVVPWLRASLNDPACQRANWRLAAGHHPILTSAGHRSSGEVLGLQSSLLPLLQAARVTAYFCGHEHHMLHLVVPPNPTIPNCLPLHIHLSGAVGDVRRGDKFAESEERLQWGHAGSSGFLHIHGNATHLLVHHVEAGTGTVLHASTQQRLGKRNDAAPQTAAAGVTPTPRVDRPGVGPLPPIETDEAEDELLTLVAFGDWGEDSEGLAQVSATYHREYPDLSAVLLMGDNFYGKGVHGVNDPQWDLFRRLAAPRPSLPYFPILGNHDHCGNQQAQLDFAALHPQWLFPAFSHRHIFKSRTTSLCVHFLDTITWEAEGASAVEWLRSSLMDDACQRAHWRLIVGHYPLLTAGTYRDSSFALLRERLNPLMVAAGVSAYICGHEHNMQHLRDPESKMDILIAGAVAQPRFHKGIRASHPALVWSNEQSTGFLHLTATPAHLAIDFVQSGNAQVLHSVRFTSSAHE